MPWPSIQRDFASALRDPECAVPAAIARTASRAPLKRFNVYRNNIAVSLTEAVGAGYPVVRQLVGKDFFDAMARVYVDANRPRSPVMLEYGDTFADFIAEFEPARGLPFLADVARVEWAWARAYHAQDAEPADIALLQTIAPETLATTGLVLHPSLQVIASKWPVASIWHCHQTDDDPAAAMSELSPVAEYAIIVRPRMDVDVRLIDAATAQVVSALGQGCSLGAAAEPLMAAGEADLGAMLQLLFGAGCVVGLSSPRSD